MREGHCTKTVTESLEGSLMIIAQEQVQIRIRIRIQSFWIRHTAFFSHLILVSWEKILEFGYLGCKLPGSGEDDVAELDQPLLRRRIEGHHPEHVTFINTRVH